MEFQSAPKASCRERLKRLQREDNMDRSCIDHRMPDAYIFGLQQTSRDKHELDMPVATGRRQTNSRSGYHHTVLYLIVSPASSGNSKYTYIYFEILYKNRWKRKHRGIGEDSAFVLTHEAFKTAYWKWLWTSLAPVMMFVSFKWCKCKIGMARVIYIFTVSHMHITVQQLHIDASGQM
uniref:Uncharacterized protein n=1 Tax=Hyaloperonospora arabidopsidis (strain Emoy2) TaxID=559515 RepID=M4C330_HYAAE